MAEFPIPPLFEAPTQGNPLECRDEIWHQNTRIVALPDGEEIMTIAFFVLTQYRRVTDGQTDGQTDTFLSQRPALAQRRAGNNGKANSIRIGSRFLADRTNGRAYATVLRPSVVVCNVMYCG